MLDPALSEELAVVRGTSGASAPRVSYAGGQKAPAPMLLLVLVLPLFTLLSWSYIAFGK